MLCANWFIMNLQLPTSPAIGVAPPDLLKLLHTEPEYARPRFPDMLASVLRRPICNAAILKSFHRIMEPLVTLPLVPVHHSATETSVITKALGNSPRLPKWVEIPKHFFRNLCLCHELPEDRSAECSIPGHPISYIRPPTSSTQSSAPTLRLGVLSEAAAAQPVNLRNHPSFRTVEELLEILGCLYFFGTTDKTSSSESIFRSIYTPFLASQSNIPLTLAVAYSSLRLVRFLLFTAEAHPGACAGVAVKTAIRQKDMKMVKLLIQRGEEDQKDDEEGVIRPFKRRRINDGTRVTLDIMHEAVQEDEEAIVTFLRDRPQISPEAKKMADAYLSGMDFD